MARPMTHEMCIACTTSDVQQAEHVQAGRGIDSPRIFPDSPPLTHSYNKGRLGKGAVLSQCFVTPRFSAQSRVCLSALHPQTHARSLSGDLQLHLHSTPAARRHRWRCVRSSTKCASLWTRAASMAQKCMQGVTSWCLNTLTRPGRGGLGVPGLVRDWGRIKGKPTQYLYKNHTKNNWSGKTGRRWRASSRDDRVSCRV